MTQVRVSEETYRRLVRLKKGMDTFDDVIQLLLKPAEEYRRILEGYRDGGKALEADAAPNR